MDSPPSSDRPSRFEPLAVVLLALAALGLFSGERALFDADEGRYAAVGRNMAESGDWVVPRLDDMPFLDKPPLVYWVQASLLQVVPPTPLVARASSILASALWVLFVFLLAARLSGRRDVAWSAAVVAGTSAAGMLGARYGPMVDMPLAACVAGALLAALRGVERAARAGGGPGVVSSIGLGVAVGLGLLAKGPLAVALPGVVALGWVIAGASPRAVFRTAFAPVAWLTALAVAAPWYILIERAQPGWIRHFVVYEHFGRFGRGDHRDFAPFWFYVPVAFIYLLPMCPLLWGRTPSGAGRGRRLLAPVLDSAWSPLPWRRALTAALPLGRGGGTVSGGHLAFAWFAMGFLMYSVSTRKLLNYLLPVAAPLFVLAGAHLVALVDRSRRGATWFPMGVGVVTIGVGVSVLLGLWFPLATGALPSSIEAPRYATLARYVIASGALLFVGALVASRSRRTVAVLALATLGFWWLLDLGLARSPDLASSRGLAAVLDLEAGAETPVVTYRRYPQGLDYYRAAGAWMAGGRPTAFRQREIVEPFATRYWLSQPRDAAGVMRWTGAGGLLTREEFEALWAGRRRVLVVCRYAEIAPLGGRIVSGPHAGAARTDLYVIDNGRPRRRGD